MREWNAESAIEIFQKSYKIKYVSCVPIPDGYLKLQKEKKTEVYKIIKKEHWLNKLHFGTFRIVKRTYITISAK